MSEFGRVDTTANRLKQRMKECGKKQVDLARETGIDKGSISNYVSGRYEPKQMAIYNLAKALDCSEMWLWGYDIPKERPAEQKENDALVELIDRLQKDRAFRRLVLHLDSMPQQKLENIMNLFDVNVDS